MKAKTTTHLNPKTHQKANVPHEDSPWTQRKPRVCVCGCGCVCASVCVCLNPVCEAESCVRRARHVIQRNPPPETRGSEGDSIGYKASANICPEQCKSWWKHQLGALVGPLRFILFPLDLSFGIIESVHPGRRISFSTLKVNVTGRQHNTGINWQPQIVWVSAFLLLLCFWKKHLVIILMFMLFSALFNGSIY